MAKQQTETERKKERKKLCGGFKHDENSVSGNNLLEHYTVPVFFFPQSLGENQAE